MNKKVWCLIFLAVSLGLSMQSKAQDESDSPFPVHPAIKELYQKYPDGKLEPSQLKIWLENPEPQVRYHALIRLDIQHPESLEIIQTAFKDQDEQVRKQAKILLVQKLGSRSIPFLVERLELEGFYDQIDTLEQLEYLAPTGFAPALLKAWMEQTARDWQNIEDVPEDWLYKLGDAYLAALTEVPQIEMAEALKPLLESSDPRRRLMALNLLLSLEGDAGEETLSQWLQAAQSDEERLKIVETLWLENLSVKDQLLFKTLVRAAFTEKDTSRAWNLRYKLSIALDLHQYDDIKKQIHQLVVPYLQAPVTRLKVLKWLKNLDKDSPLFPIVLDILEKGSLDEVQAALVTTEKLKDSELQAVRLRILNHPNSEIQVVAFRSLLEHQENDLIVEQTAKRFASSSDKNLQSVGLNWLLEKADPEAERLLFENCDGKSKTGSCWSVLELATRKNRLDYLPRLKPWLYEQDSDLTKSLIILFERAQADVSTYLEPFFMHRQGYFSHDLVEIWQARNWNLPEQLADLIVPNKMETHEVLTACLKYPDGFSSPKLIAALQHYLQHEKEPYRLQAALFLWKQLTSLSKEQRLAFLKTLSLPLEPGLEKIVRQARIELGDILDANWQDALLQGDFSEEYLRQLAVSDDTEPDFGIRLLKSTRLPQDERLNSLFIWLFNRNTPKGREALLRHLDKLEGTALKLAMTVLGAWGEKRAVPHLKILLEHSDRKIRAEALLTLAVLQTDGLEKVLATFLRSDDGLIRESSLKAFALLQIPLDMTIIFDAFQTLPPEIQRDYLSLIYFKGGPTFLRQALESSRVESAAVAERDKTSFRSLFAKASQDSESTFEHYAEWFSELPPAGFTDCQNVLAEASLLAKPWSLIPLLKHTNPQLRKMAAQVASYWPTLDWIAPLQAALLTETDSSVRAYLLASGLKWGLSETHEETYQRIMSAPELTGENYHLTYLLLAYGSTEIKARLIDDALKLPQGLKRETISRIATELKLMDVYKPRQHHDSKTIPDNNILKAFHKRPKLAEKPSYENYLKLTEPDFATVIAGPFAQNLLNQDMPYRSEEMIDFDLDAFRKALIQNGFPAEHPTLEKLATTLPLRQAAYIRQLQYELLLARGEQAYTFVWLKRLSKQAEAELPSQRFWRAWKLLEQTPDGQKIEKLQELKTRIENDFTYQDWSKQPVARVQTELALAWEYYLNGHYEQAKASIRDGLFALRRIDSGFYSPIYQAAFHKLAAYLVRESDSRVYEQELMLSLFWINQALNYALKEVDQLNLPFSVSAVDTSYELLRLKTTQREQLAVSRYQSILYSADGLLFSHYRPCLKDISSQE